jgi:SAM-dependent methyltransferase
MTNPTIFDPVAAGYDASFTHTHLGRMLRRRVWSLLEACFRPGEHILELACGTGEDATWLAGRGVRVTATDAAAQMVAAAVAKVHAAGLANLVQVQQLSLQQVAGSALRGPFDGVLSNFGGLNCMGEWRPLAQALATVVRPGGAVALVVMGPWCPWEIVWCLLHRRPRDAFRRRRQPATARIGGTAMPVWYPAAGQLCRDFSPWFRRRSGHSLGLWLPPTYLGRLVERHPAFFNYLDRIERATAHLAGACGDHYVLILERQIEAGIRGK